MLWSTLTITLGVLSAFLLRGFADGARAGDPEYYILLGALACAAIAAATLERRLRAI